MSTILQELSPANLVTAFEDNLFYSLSLWRRPLSSIRRRSRRMKCGTRVAALARPEPRQVQMIRRWYPEGRPAALGLRLSYVYVLRGRALARLRRILAEAG